jgi:hypothetical protein
MFTILLLGFPSCSESLEIGGVAGSEVNADDGIAVRQRQNES